MRHCHLCLLPQGIVCQKFLDAFTIHRTDRQIKIIQGNKDCKKHSSRHPSKKAAGMPGSFLFFQNSYTLFSKRPARHLNALLPSRCKMFCFISHFHICLITQKILLSGGDAVTICFVLSSYMWQTDNLCMIFIFLP